MSYPMNGGMLNFFHPNIPLATTTAGVLREIDIGAASADHGEMFCFKPCVVKRLLVAVTGEAISGTSTDPTVVFKRRPTPLSATGEVLAGTVTLPTGTAVGKTVFKEINVNFAIGDSMEIAHTIGVGTPTGKGFASMECYAMEEEPANNSDMIKSV